jgi:hypothetical protein
LNSDAALAAGEELTIHAQSVFEAKYLGGANPILADFGLVCVYESQVAIDCHRPASFCGNVPVSWFQ